MNTETNNAAAVDTSAAAASVHTPVAVNAAAGMGVLRLLPQILAKGEAHLRAGDAAEIVSSLIFAGYLVLGAISNKWTRLANAACKDFQDKGLFRGFRTTWLAGRLDAVANVWVQNEYLANFNAIGWTEREDGAFVAKCGPFNFVREPDGTHTASATARLNTAFSGLYGACTDDLSILDLAAEMLNAEGFNLENPRPQDIHALSSFGKMIDDDRKERVKVKAASKPTPVETPKAPVSAADTQESAGEGSPNPEVPDHAQPVVNAIKSLLRAVAECAEVVEPTSVLWKADSNFIKAINKMTHAFQNKTREAINKQEAKK